MSYVYVLFAFSIGPIGWIMFIYLQRLKFITKLIIIVNELKSEKGRAGKNDKKEVIGTEENKERIENVEKDKDHSFDMSMVFKEKGESGSNDINGDFTTNDIEKNNIN